MTCESGVKRIHDVRIIEWECVTSVRDDQWTDLETVRADII